MIMRASDTELDKTYRVEVEHSNNHVTCRRPADF
jgi:hypothetical protein